MNDPAKYIKLFWLLLLSVVAFIVVTVLLFLGMRLLMDLVNQLPFITVLYTLFVLSVPPGIFISAFAIFLSRTRSHVSKIIRIISFILLGSFLVAWIVCYIMDIITFVKTSNTEVLAFNSWNLIFLTASVAGLFIVGIVQALGTAKEEDWLERHKRKHPEF